MSGAAEYMKYINKGNTALCRSVSSSLLSTITNRCLKNNR